MEILSEFTICEKKYCTVKTKGGVSVMENGNITMQRTSIWRIGGNRNGCSRNSNDGKRMEET